MEDKKQQFLGSGSYGCIYYPGFNCQGKYNKNKKYITKIQIKSYTTQNEIYMGKIIRHFIPKYNNYFNIVIKNCKIQLNKIEDISELDKCNIIYKHLDNSYYTNNSTSKLHKQNLFLTYSRKINGLTIATKFQEFVKKNYDTKYIIKAINSIYLYLNKSINLLTNNDIIHNDLHHSNIMITNNNNKPIIIDFGLAYNKKNNFKKNFEKFLYNSHINPERIHDCFSKHLIRYLIYKCINEIENSNTYFINDITTISTNKFQEYTNFLDSKMISEIINYMTSYLFAELNIIDNDNKIVNYITSSLERYLNKYKNKIKYRTLYDIFFSIYNDSVTIDKYSVNFIFIEFLTLNNEIVTRDKYLYNYFSFFKQIYIIQLNPNPEETFKYNQCIKYINYIILKIKKIDINSIQTEYTIFMKDITDYCKKNNISKIVNLYNIDYQYLFDKTTIKLIQQI